MGEMRRKGDVEMCPACGWGLAASAYHCPECRIYFCYKCRCPVGRRRTVADDQSCEPWIRLILYWAFIDAQFECADHSCDCYGKLVCIACVIERIDDKHFTKYNPDVIHPDVIHADFTVAGLIIGGGVAVACLAIPTSIITFGGALVVGTLAAFGSITFAGKWHSFNTFGSKDKRTTQPPTPQPPSTKTTTDKALCCVQCRNPVKRIN